ncbi:glycerol transporter [Neocucurbitaria cava]|uniref:Glycerol transporter n=1 Tax=Neocucurbitaria cava TaxID=798079 RepID=A0A9W8Y430_9PLEO|nr:glycerol transporter [Neocucurbitaria cava]
MALRYFRQLYALDTLDTRFVVPATAPPKEALEEAKLDPAGPLPVQNGRGKSKDIGDNVQPPRWNTTEFYFYGVVIAVCVVLMFKSVLDVSSESHPNYPKFSHLLDDGWIPGRKVDNSDAQYSGFRSNILYLFVVVLLHPVLRKAYDSFWRADTYTQVRPSAAGNGGLTMGLTASAAADARLSQRVSFDILFAGVFLVALHGFSTFKILAILYANYSIATKLPREYIPAATWIFNVGTLFANEFSRGYSYATILGIFLSPPSEKDDATMNFGELLDSYGGLMPRWEILFKFTLLRLISFNLDYYWSLNSRASSPWNDYTFRNYLAYTLYSPLYLAGPIVTFNDYISQQRYRPHSITPARTTKYLIRFLIVLLTMEVMIHYMYMVAIFHAAPSWSTYTPAQLSMLGFFNLKHIWLKLLIPWRFFRLWALLDGIDPPENMVRCMSDNYSVMHFWRGWHRSFNKWSLRYLYIPLGGSAVPGAWGRLLMWGWLVTLFVLPEIIASYVFPAKKWRDRPDAYRWLCGVGAVGEILMLMMANLVGFALGLDGLGELVRGIFGTVQGWVFLGTSCAALFMAVQVMFELREGEKRRGIVMKC